MGVDEGQVKPKKKITAAQVADWVMKQAPGAVCALAVVVTKDGNVLMMRTPMGFDSQSMVTAVINHDMNETTAGYASAAGQKNGDSH